MALADPQSVTIGGTATPLPRVLPNQFGKADGTVILTINHRLQKNSRYDGATLKLGKVTTDPFVPSQNVQASVWATISVSRAPKAGVDLTTDATNIAKALRDWATDANIAKLLGGES